MSTQIFFETAAQDLEPERGGTHVFWVALEEALARPGRFEKLLSTDEHARAERFQFSPDRDRYVAARGTLREILGWLLRAHPRQLVFARGERGKPRLAAPVAGRFLHFNLTHSGMLVGCAVSARDEVGVDVERVRPIREADSIAAQFFSAREYSEWRSLPVGHRTGAFFEYWTGKEALLKALGCGLGGLVQREVTPSGDSLARALGRTPDAPEHSNFRVHRLVPAPGYTAAAATKNARPPRCWKWPAL